MKEAGPRYAVTSPRIKHNAAPCLFKPAKNAVPKKQNPARGLIQACLGGEEIDDANMGMPR